MPEALQLPLTAEVIRSLHAGDAVLLSGVILTGRDAVHKWLTETFIQKTRQPDENDLQVYRAIQPVMDGGVIYHCGPVVAGLETGQYRFVAAGPTTSIREEAYQAGVLRHFNLKGMIGKGGMGSRTLQTCQELPAVYFHAVGGAAALLAETVQRVLGVHKLEFGVPEAIWIIEVRDFPAVVTMDAHGVSLHEAVRRRSQAELDRLLDG